MKKLHSIFGMQNTKNIEDEKDDEILYDLLNSALDISSNIYQEKLTDDYIIGNPLSPYIDKEIYDAFPKNIEEKVHLDLCQFLSPSISKLDWIIYTSRKDQALEYLTFSNMLGYNKYDLERLFILKDKVLQNDMDYNQMDSYYTIHTKYRDVTIAISNLNEFKNSWLFGKKG